MSQYPDIRLLADQILERQEMGSPFILFLGRECAAAAGVPSTYKIARQMFTDPDLANLYLHDTGIDDRQGVLNAFDELMGEMTSGQRYRILQSFYANIPVPSFYQDLVLLIRAGYFRHILTTNIDNLLEQALSGAGMAENRDYQVIVPGQGEMLPWRHRPSEATAVQVNVIKLHGDLAQQQVSFTREEISDALEPQRAFIKGELSGDLVMVGYEFESEPLNQWLSWVPGELWWVSAEAPDDERMEPIQERRRMNWVRGDRARPELFFGHLAWFLPRQPGQGEAPPGPPVTESQSPAAQGEGAAADDYSDVAYLEAQLQRSQALLKTLEGAQTPAEKNVQLELQIEYQRRQVAVLEEQLRNLEPYRTRVLDLVGRLRQSLERASQQETVEEDAAAYLASQIESIEQQYRQENPNQAVVSAAISATVVLVERLDAEVIDAQAVEELAGYAPSVLGRRWP
jgi:hypothetical protein